jgi:hypothetical protein
MAGPEEWSRLLRILINAYADFPLLSEVRRAKSAGPGLLCALWNPFDDCRRTLGGKI